MSGNPWPAANPLLIGVNAYVSVRLSKAGQEALERHAEVFQRFHPGKTISEVVELYFGQHYRSEPVRFQLFQLFSVFGGSFPDHPGVFPDQPFAGPLEILDRGWR